jgi:hypothetical protein
MEDRRRSPRIVPKEAGTLHLTVRRPVQVAELSAGGSLLITSSLASERPAAGELRMSLGGAPFAAQVRLCRVERPAGEARVLLGAAFDTLSPEAQRALDEVLGRATNQNGG